MIQRARRVGCQAPGVSDGGKGRRRRYAVADCGIALAIHRDAGHPPVQAIAPIRERLLLHRRTGDRAAGDVDLCPLEGSRTAGHSRWTNGVDHPQRFRPADVAILRLHHQAVTEAVEVRRRPRLRNNVRVERGRERRAIAALGDLCRSREGRVGGGHPIDVKLVDVVGENEGVLDDEIVGSGSEECCSPANTPRRCRSGRNSNNSPDGMDWPF